MNSFYDDFDSKKFGTRMEAKNSLTPAMQENQARFNTCTQAANIKYNERLADYRSKGGKNFYTFQQTYSSIIGACNASPSDLSAMQAKIDQKIKSIVDPDPTIEKIKTDLIGQQTFGWTFQHLNEFKSAQILNTSRGTDRIEYQLRFDLVGNSDTSTHECETMVTYLQSDYGWYLGGVTMNYIVFTNTFYPDRYSPIMPLQNCKWNADNNSKMGWKTSNSEYEQEIVTGPDKGQTTLPYASVYYIRSLENHEIRVRFTYRPNY